MDIKLKIRKLIREQIELLFESSYNYVLWSHINNDTRVDIIENIYGNSEWLQKNYNIWTFKEYVDDSGDNIKLKEGYNKHLYFFRNNEAILMKKL